ncbi:hypothetical protein BWQ96_09011 [Gracilariopsis chorda]|uniref:FIST domain-containing protein n=1 Tax=Gracilariopsis chorda TaxID=448386 RepID=A0A2V3IGP2_9FLOR|nr:hypothetical protein BWQ96_09011 [Gracilariopsis chorda]|eukprot:PXF41251.1 hypothetical protein BWQ96_09011 [Gracilariopsis chorda]
MPLDALQEALARAANTFSATQRTVSVVFVFLNSSFESTPASDMRRVGQTVKKTLAMRRLLTSNTKIFGCSSAHYVGPDKEPSVSVALAHFPGGTTLSTFHIDENNNFSIDWKQKQWHDIVGIPPDTEGQLQIFLLHHPEYEHMGELIAGLDFAYPGVRKFGASAGKTNALHDECLFHGDDRSRREGVIGLAFSSPDVQIDVMVAQGARGVGPVLEVLEVKDGNEITRVKEVNTPGATIAPPMVLLDMWAKTDNISYDERLQARKYLLLGVEVPKVADLAISSLSPDRTKEEVPESQKPIDMVIRKVVGFNEATKSIGVDGDVRLGSRVQFQIRDDEAARAELYSLFNKMSLEGSSKAMEGLSLMGALLLVDVERGANLFGDATPDADRALFADRFPVPLAVLTSDRQIGPLPAGGLLGAAGNTFSLSASALYITFFGRVSEAKIATRDEDSSNR